jgi:hypothetical protein
MTKNDVKRETLGWAYGGQAVMEGGARFIAALLARYPSCAEFLCCGTRWGWG